MEALLVSSRLLSGTVTAAGSLRATHRLSTEQGQTSIFEGSWGRRKLGTDRRESDHLGMFGSALFRAPCLMLEGGSHERRPC